MIFNYKRVSTTDQNTERQLLKVACDREYVEKISGKNTNRPELQAMLLNIRAGDVVNVHSMDRLARNTKDLLNLVEEITNKGAKIVFHKENLIFAPDKQDPYQKMMAQLLADRLAEAAAERMHEQVRKEYWGYAKGEQLTIPEMLIEKFQGIRPAVGYPSLPDTSLNFVLDELIDMKQIGIRLTESGAMKPHASVSGLMMAHPQARYFNLGKIGEDQLQDYARRRGLPIEVCRKVLAANL